MENLPAPAWSRGSTKQTTGRAHPIRCGARTRLAREDWSTTTKNTAGRWLRSAAQESAPWDPQPAWEATPATAESAAASSSQAAEPHAAASVCEISENGWRYG